MIYIYIFMYINVYSILKLSYLAQNSSPSWSPGPGPRACKIAQEGVCSEAASLAGHLKLHKLIVFYDDAGPGGGFLPTNSQRSFVVACFYN